MTERASDRPSIVSMGDSIFFDGNHFVIRYDENLKPVHFECNGEEVTEAQFRMLGPPSFPSEKK